MLNLRERSFNLLSYESSFLQQLLDAWKLTLWPFPHQYVLDLWEYRSKIWPMFTVAGVFKSRPNGRRIFSLPCKTENSRAVLSFTLASTVSEPSTDLVIPVLKIFRMALQNSLWSNLTLTADVEIASAHLHLHDHFTPLITKWCIF